MAKKIFQIQVIREKLFSRVRGIEKMRDTSSKLT